MDDPQRGLHNERPSIDPESLAAQADNAQQIQDTMQQRSMILIGVWMFALVVLLLCCCGLVVRQYALR